MAIFLTKAFSKVQVAKQEFLVTFFDILTENLQWENSAVNNINKTARDFALQDIFIMDSEG